MAIQFFFHKKNITLTQRIALKQFLQQIFEVEKKKLLNLTYIFCSDEYLLEINKTHLQHNYYTDIITFDLSGNTDFITGEIYISADRVKDNAVQLRVSLNEELHRVIFHGTLHLCGYRDKTIKNKKDMRLAENRLLKMYFR